MDEMNAAASKPGSLRWAHAKTAPRHTTPKATAREGPAPPLLTHARRVLARLPAAAWACALLALLNAVCWSLITPPFLGPDEADHFAYVQQIAEGGSLPSSTLIDYAPEESKALEDLHYTEVRFRPEDHPIFAKAEQQTLRRDLALPLSRRGRGQVGVSASQPPLYYALEAVPYGVASKGTILDRLALMRLLSATMAGLTALFVFLFLREALPAARWAWTVGGAGVAFAPQLGFVSGAVNPDAMLQAVAAALFYCVARAFRRGLTSPLAVAIGALIGAGLVTKLNFLGLLPGAIGALFVLTRREARTFSRRAYQRLLAPALAVAASPVVLYALLNASGHRAIFGVGAGSAAGLTNGHKSFAGELGYIWQFYLPRLPGMHNDFGEIFTTRQIWFRNVVGLYGWLDTVFPGWVYGAALVPAGVITALCLRELVLSRLALRARLGELGSYAFMAFGLLALVGAAGYSAFPARKLEFSEPRYLLPLLALWGAALALAARGAGRRWGPVVGILIIVLAMAHDIFSQLQVVARYYS